eukprot:scaffold14911_cov54-Attheya_sp.AAC.4
MTIELSLEAWFEWIVLSDLQYLDSLHWTCSFGALGMLTAHWIYLIAAGIDLIFIPDSGADSDANEDEEDGDKEEVEINIEITENCSTMNFENSDSKEDSNTGTA